MLKYKTGISLFLGGFCINVNDILRQKHNFESLFTYDKLRRATIEICIEGIKNFKEMKKNSNFHRVLYKLKPIVKITY